MAQQTNKQTANRTDILISGLVDYPGLLEALFPDFDRRLSERWPCKKRTKRLMKRLRHRCYMQSYRHRPEYRRSDRAYNVVEYLVRCLRAGWEPAECVLRLVGVASVAEFRRRFEQAMGGTLDLASYGVTWFVAHKKPIRNFDFSDPEQFRECVSVMNLARGEIAKPWRKPRSKPGDASPPLPGLT